jgi:hypothetical protein
LLISQDIVIFFKYLNFNGDRGVEGMGIKHIDILFFKLSEF